ncbi:hypothetical protein R1flu_019553 [Riccia fluitans]|uniref:Protein kinase domain-containing protein n=1 Tax=Riccia fluitans TaxID=41844 RepID=A0ABD1ZKF6_9MARC
MCGRSAGGLTGNVFAFRVTSDPPARVFGGALGCQARNEPQDLVNMDSRLRWITLVLLLVVFLPKRSCEHAYSLTCNQTTISAEGYLIYNKSCQVDPADYLSLNGEDLIMTGTGGSSANITFIFNLGSENQSPPLAYTPPLPPRQQPQKISTTILDNGNNCSYLDHLEWAPTSDNSNTLQTKWKVFSNNTRLLKDNSESCNHRYFDIIFEVSHRTTNDNTTEGSRGNSGGRNGLILGVTIGGVAFMLIVVIFFFMARRRVPWRRLSPMNSTNSKDNDFSSINDSSDLEIVVPRQYSYKELSSATHGFSSKYIVGEGGFGTVYKGVLKETRCPVAIKRLSQYARQGEREFMAEVKIISQLRHRNLVQLLGWCYEKDELVLVYEYMPNGDLDDLIFADNPKTELSWKQRYNIFCGVATALVYLHEEWEQRVVHRDVKTSNVMLDRNLNARVGDFGLARLSAHSQAPRSTLVAGTLGYLAPEFNTSGKATNKTDVYGFGVVVLEVTCAKRPLSPDLILVDWVWNHHKQGTLLEAVDQRLDPKLRSSDDEVLMKTVLQIGLLCCHPDPEARPNMRQVLNILKGEASLPRVPRSKPVASYSEDD